MRENLLQWLVCPACGGKLKLEVMNGKESEIIEGTLSCKCTEIYPIISGVPRLLCGPIRDNLPELYPEFFHRYSHLIDIKIDFKENDLKNKTKETASRFGYEWEHFSEYNCNNFKSFIAPLPDNFFKGKLGLDVGCGAGRHARQASELGAEIIGIDLSQAVDAARKNNMHNKQVHIIQADIYNLPFKHEVFHFIYSLGVLQHLPEPEKGYQALVQFLKREGALFIWVYAYAKRKVVLEILRTISQRLSNDNIRRMAFFCNLIDFGIFINLYRLLNNLPLIVKWVQRYSPLRIKEYAEYGCQVGYTDWFDRLSAPITNYYKENEMLSWLERSELVNTKLLLEGDSWWWLYGERKTSE